MSDLNQDIDRLRSLGVDMSGIDRAIAERQAADAALVDARRRLGALRMGDKDYAREAQSISSMVNALELTFSGAGDDLRSEVEAAKDAAIEGAAALDDVRRRIFELRRAAVVSMCAAAEAVIQEHELAKEAGELFGAVAGWILERRGEVGGAEYLKGPGGVARKQTWGEAVRAYFERFVALRTSPSAPQPGDELKWFDNRTR